MQTMIHAVIQTRMFSTRPRGKSVMAAHNKLLLAPVIKRIRAIPSIDKIKVTTTIDAADDLIDPMVRERNDWSTTEIDLLRVDYSKAKSILGWKPETSCKELTKLMVDHDLELARCEAARNAATCLMIMPRRPFTANAIRQSSFSGKQSLNTSDFLLVLTIIKS